MRTRRGWSLDALAARAGVSKGMLVQIEQGRTNPSLGTLCRVAEAFDVSLGRLVELDDTPSVRRVRADEVVELWHGAHGGRGSLLISSDRPERLELWDWRLGPGDRHAVDAHAVDTREVLFVLDGLVTVELDRERHEAGAGEVLLFGSDRPHAYANGTDGPVRFVMLVAQPPLPSGRPLPG